MGIGRRKFITLSSLALAGLAVDPFQAVAINNNAYVNKKLGVLFHKPQNWDYIHVHDFGKLKDKQVLGNGWEEMRDEFWEDFDDPICVITKYHQDLPEYEGVFSPTITVNVEDKHEFENYTDGNYEEIIRLSEQGTSLFLEEFKVTKRYDPIFLSECKVFEYDSSYLFNHIELEKPLKVELKVLKAEHKEFYYSINMHHSFEAQQTAHKEFDNFKKSLRFI